MKVKALIIAEVTGSITVGERKELQQLRRISSRARLLSQRMHEFLDPLVDEITQIRTTSAAKIVALGNQMSNEF